MSRFQPAGRPSFASRMGFESLAVEDVYSSDSEEDAPQEVQGDEPPAQPEATEVIPEPVKAPEPVK